MSYIHDHILEFMCNILKFSVRAVNTPDIQYRLSEEKMLHLLVYNYINFGMRSVTVVRQTFDSFLYAIHK